MSNELIRIIKREALQNALDELESYLFNELIEYADLEAAYKLIDKLNEIRKNL